MELLEDRIAPAVTAKINHNVLNVQGTAAGDVIGLRLQAGHPNQLEVLSQGVPIANSPFPTSAFTQITVQGKGGTDTLVIDTSNGSPVPSGGIAFAGDGGGNTLVAPNTANTWSITGADAGTLDGLVSFTQVQNLTGGNSADTFQFAAGGSVSGVINGGSGPLSLDAGSGTLTIRNNVLSGGGGDLSFTGGTITVNPGATISTGPDGGTAGNATFAAHTSAGDGSVSLAGNIFTHGKDLTVLADAGIVLNTQSGPATLSTRQTGAGSNPAIAPSTGDSGNITFTGTSITLGSPPNATAAAGLFAQAGAGSSFKAGNIDLTVSQEAGALFPQFVDLGRSTVGITVNHATLMGGTVTLLADAEHSHVFDIPSQTPFQTTVQTAISQLQHITLIGGVAVSSADAEISLGQGSSIQANTFNAVAFALTDAESKPITAVQGGVAVAVVNSKAVVTAAGNITTTGDAFIQARTENTVLAVGDAFGNVAGVTPAVAVGVENAQTTAHVTSSAVLNVGGNLTVQANTENRKALLARTATGSDGRLGVAVAVDFTKDDTNALVDGSVTVGGDATIEAAETKDGVNTTKFFIPTLFAGVAADAGVNTSSTGDFLTDQQNALVSTLIGQVSNLVQAASEGQQQPGQLTQGEAPTFQAAAGVAVDYETNNVTARIGDNTAPTPATVRDAGNLTVDANINDRPVVIAGSSTSGTTNPPGTPSTDPTKYAGSVAVALGTYNNTATSYINSGSVVDAGKNLAVTSEALNDYQFAYGINLYQAAMEKPTHTTDEPGANAVPIDPGDIVEVKDGHTGGGTVGDWYQYAPLVPATLDLATEDFTDATRWQDLGPGWEVKTQGFVGGFTSYLDNSFGADANLADTWSQATTGGAQEAVAGSFTLLTLNQTSNAFIASGARVNQDPTLRTGGQNVSVVATGVNSSVDLGGSVQTPGIQGDGTEFTIDPTKPGAGTQAGKNAVGAAFVVVHYNDDVTATINNGVRLYADSLVVDAENSVSNVSVMISGETSGNIGFNGAFSLVNVADTTLAQVDNGARVAVGAAAVSATDPASAEVRANDVTHLYNIVGGVTVAKNKGVGASVAVAQVQRDTEAVIGDLSTTALVGDKPTGTDKTLNAGGPLVISAENGGFVRSLSLAAAVAAAGPLANTSLVRTLLHRGGKAGIGLSADVSDNQVSDTTLAYIHDAVVGAAGAAVAATNDTEIQALSGSAAIVAKVTGSSKGLAGSYAQNTLGGTTNAFVDNSSLALTGDLAVVATTTGEIFAISASGSVAPTAQGNSVAGQLSENDLGTTTEADVADGSVVSAGNASLSARDTDSIFAVAGALAFGGKDGLGTAVSLNNLPGSGQAHTVRADLRNSDLQAAGQTTIEAEAHEGIRAITAAVGAGLNGMAAAAAISVNTIAPDTEAFVTGKLAQGVRGGGNLALTAKDDSTLEADGGGGGLTGGKAGFGISFALNTITGDTTAEILGTPVTLTAGTIQEKATSSATIEVTAVGGAAAAGTGGSNAVAAGFGLGLNAITDAVLATVDGATVQSTGLDVEAGSAPQISVLALGAGGAISTTDGGGKSLVGAGAGSSNTIQDTVEASLRDGSTATTSGGAVTLAAQDTSQITADAGGFALTVTAGQGGGKALSVGASVAANSIANSVQAMIDRATVSGAGGVDLSALESASIRALTVAGSASVVAGQGGSTDFAAAGAGSGNTISDTTAALVTGGSVVSSGPGQGVDLTAADESAITANAGGVALSGSGSSTGGGLGGAVGASAAVNTISNAVTAAIDGSTVHAGGGVDLVATEAAQISVLALGVTGTLSGSLRSNTGVDGAGSASVNIITDSTEASIRDNSAVTSGAGYGITVHASDTSAIAAEAGAGALNITGGGLGSKSGSLGFSLTINTITNTVTAAVDDSSVASGGGLDLGAAAGEQVQAVTAAGAVAAAVGAQKSLAFAGAGAVSVNIISNTVTAHVSGGSHITSAGSQAVDLTAADDSSITADAGALAFSAGAGESGGTAAVGAAAAANFISNTVSAFVDNSTVTAGGDVALSATAAATVLVITVGVSGAMSVSGAGSASTNTTRNKVMAGITGRSTVSAGGRVQATAEDDSSITSAAGAGSLSIVAGSNSTKVGVALSFSIAVNDILDSTAAVIDGSSASGGAGVGLDADTRASITAVTVAGSLAGAFGSGTNLTLTGVGAGSVNTVSNTTAARVTGSSVHTGNGPVQVQATDDSSITANAGAISVSVGGGNGFTGSGTVGASFAVNTVSNNVQALLDDALVTSGGSVHVAATSGMDILAITVGFSGAGAVAIGATSLAIAGGGAFSTNTVANTTQAALRNGSQITTAGGGDVSVQATDNTTIQAAAGSGALAIAGGTGVGVAGTIAFSVAVNTVADGTEATVDGATVASAGNVFVNATSTSAIDAVTAAGAVAGTAGTSVGLSFAGVGAGSVNTVSNTTTASITRAAVVSTGSGQLAQVTAADDAHIKADGGALTLGISAGTNVRGAAVVGASFAVNTITDTARATIDGATVTSGGGVDVEGSSAATIESVAVGAAGAVAIGTIGVALAGAGSAAVNTVSDTVEGSVKDGSRVTSGNGGKATLKATDGASITAGSGVGVLAGAGGPTGGIGLALGFSMSVNTISDSARAFAADSTVYGSGGVVVQATSTASIEAVTAAGAIVGTGGSLGGLSFTGAGAGSGNTISNTTEADLARSTVSTDSGGSVRVLAADNSTITAGAGAIGVAIAGGATAGGAAAAGAAVAVNTITNTVRATLDGATVASGGLDVEATSGGSILAVAAGASGALGVAAGGGVALAGAASATANTVSNTLEASVKDQSSVNAGGAAVLRAIDGAAIQAVSGSGALAGGGGAIVGLSGAVGIALSANSVADTVKAFVDGATVTGGRVEVSATSQADLMGLTLGGAGAIGGAATVGGALAGAGAGSGNTIADVITAQVTGGSVVRATAGDVVISATDDSSIEAGAGGAAFAISGAGVVGIRIAIGASVLVNDLGNTVQAFADNATVSAARDVSLSAQSTASVKALSLGGVLAVGGSAVASVALAVAGSTVTDMIHDTIQASVQDSAQVTAGRNVALTALDNSSIDAEAAGGSVAVGGAIGGVAGSVSLVAAVNNISNTVLAFVGGSQGTDPTRVTAAGTVSLSADSTSSIQAFADAASLAGSISIGGSLSGAGADATNNTSNVIGAFLQGGAVNAAGGLQVSATDAATVRAEVATGSLSFGLIGGSLGASATQNKVADLVIASVGDANVTTAGHDVAINATSNDKISGRAVGTTLTIAIGFAGTGCDAESTDTSFTQASVGNQALLSLQGGSLDVNAASSSKVSAEADGGAVGIAAAGDINSDAEAKGATLAFIGEGSTITAASVAVSAQAAEEADASTVVVNISAFGFGGARSQANVGHDAAAFIGSQAGTAGSGAATTITATGGTVTVAATSANKADAEANGGTGGVFNIGVLVVDADAGGSTNAYLGGNVRLHAADVSVTAEGDSTADSTGFLIGISVVGGDGANIQSKVDDNVAAFIADGSTVSVPGGLLRVQALSSPTAKADSEGIASGGVAVTVLVTEATVGGSTLAFIGQGDSVTAGALEVVAEAPNSDAEADSFALGVGIAAGAGSNTKAETGRDVEAFVGPRAGAPRTAPTSLTVNGAVTVQAADFDLPNPAGSGAQARVEATVGAGGFISAGAAVSDAVVDGTTTAYLGNGVVVHGGSLTVRANGVDAATDEALVGSGGALTGNGTDTEAHATPTLSAYLGNGVFVAVTGGVDVEAVSVHAEGHTKAESFGGGGLDIGLPKATTSTAPTVTAYLGGATTVLAGGDVTVRAAAHSDATGTFNDQIQAVDRATGTITFPSHGLSDGDFVRYVPDGSPTPLQTPSGPLDPSRSYRVVVVTPNTLKLGASFSAGKLSIVNVPTSDPIDPLNPAEGVYAGGDAIKFSGPSGFQTGDAVVYEANGNPSLGGQFTDGGTYYVKALDAYTVKLYPTRAAAEAPYRTFSPSGDVSGSTFQFNDQGFHNGDAVTYLAPAPVSFHSSDVVNTTVFFQTTSYINLASAGGLRPGDRVIYETNDTRGSPIGGLVNGHVYEVYSVLGSQIQLADPSTGLPLILTPDLSPLARSATEELRQLPIGGLQDGGTYYVTNATGSSFQLAATSQDAQQGIALPLDTSGASGSHQIGRDGIRLSPSQGTQDLRLALTGPATNGPTGDELLAPDGQSLRAINPPVGGGQSSAIAEGGSGAGVDISFPTASLSTDPTVQSYVAARQVNAGGNVTIAAESFGNINAQANNAGGGFIYVSQASATANFGDGNLPNTSRAFVGTEDPATGAVDATGVHIQAGGTFTLSSATRLNAGISSEVDGGGFLSVTEADSTLAVNSNTTAVVGSNAVIAAQNVNITADVSALQGHVESNSTTGGIFGFATANSNSNVNSTAAVRIDGGSTRISGYEGVDIRALNEQFDPGLDSNADSFILVLFVPVYSGSANDNPNDNFHTGIEADPGATVLAGPRPPDSPLQQAPGFDSLALFVQATDDNIKDGSEDRIVTWAANVQILSGPAPELIVDENGNIARAVNVSVNDGGVNKTSGPIVGNVVDVNPITGGPGGEVLMQADDQITGGATTPLFVFIDNYDHVRIINRSAKDLVLGGIDVINRGSAPLVHLDTGNLDSTFAFNITHTVSPTLIDIENDDGTQRPSNIVLAGPIENPIGSTRIVNVRGNVLSAGPSAVVRTESLDVEASGSVGTLASRILAELVESVDRATGALRPAVLTASAGTGNVDLSLTGRRRDNRMGPFTLTVNSLTAGGNVDVVIHDSVQDLGAAGQVGGVTVEAPTQGIAGTYFVHFNPDGDPSQRAGLDPGVFADLAGATPIDSTYDLTRVTAGSNVSMQAGSGTVVNLVLGTVTATNTVFLANTGTITDYADADDPDVTAYEFDVRAQGGIGTPADPLETQVRRLHVLAGNGNLWITNPGAIDVVTIDVSLTRPSVLHAGSIATMTIGPDMLVPGDDLAGQLIVDGTLGSLRVAGGTPGTIVAGHVGSVWAYGGYGPLVLQIKEGGIQRRVEAAVPGMDFPIPPPPPAPIPPLGPAGVLFQYVYEGTATPGTGTALANPQLTIRVTNSTSTAPGQFDLSLATYNDAAKFNLARLDAIGASGIRNVAVEGDILTAVTPQAAAFFQVPGPGGATVADATPAGVRLPLDNLAGVGVRDFVPNASIQAHSIQAAAFGSHAEEDGSIRTGAASSAEDAADLLTPGTATVQAHDTYRVPFADLPSQQVALFLATQPGGGRFDDDSIVLVVQGVSSPNVAGTANVVTPSNAARGAVVALVTAMPTVDGQGRPGDSVVQTIRVRGDGASMRTEQYVASLITSTGPLGDLTLQNGQGITDITAPSIFGSILGGGAITGTVQTTGLRTDPITGVVTHIVADLGRLYVDTADPRHPFVTSTVVQTDGISGELVSRADLVGEVIGHGGGDLSGVIAAQGNIGKEFTYPSGQSVRLGGIDAHGGVSADIIALGSILADVRIDGGLRGGRIAASGGIVGNLTLNGGLDAASAIVSGGEIGDAGLGTQLTLNGPNGGIIAAKGTITFAKGTPGGAVYNDTGASPGSPNTAAIDAVFTEIGQPLAFDQSGLDLGGLALLVQHLGALRVGSDGNLTDSPTP